jgi:TfoX N-terminal domain
MVLGTSAYKRGIRATTFRAEIDAGLGCQAGGAAQPLVVRTFYLNLPDTEKVTKRARALGPARPVIRQGLRHHGLDRPAGLFDWIMGVRGPVAVPAVRPPAGSGLAAGRPGSAEDRVAYDEDLAGRVRAVLPLNEAGTERQMFGGLAFMLGGHMFCGVVRDTLMVRLGPDAAGRALNQPNVRPMDFTGRPMKGMVFVEPGGLHDAALREWVTAAAAFASTLPPKPATPRACTRR